MFDEISFGKIETLPKYVFQEINDIKQKEIEDGNDVIDFSMGNPDGSAPISVIEKLLEASRGPKNHGYSVSKGIHKLRLAISDWYFRKYNIKIDPNRQAVVTLGSKEGYVHLIQAITNFGDTAIIPQPAYPIHTFAPILAGANVIKPILRFNKDYILDTEYFFSQLEDIFDKVYPKPKYIVVNFPNNPTTTTVNLDFYERLVDFARFKRFYIISDIAYADLVFDDNKSCSILQVKGAKDVAIESFTLSKSYSMAGWRVGFFVGGTKLVGILQKIKSWFDYGIFTPIQVASIVALSDNQEYVKQNIQKYKIRRDVLCDSFSKINWHIDKPHASMFIWAKMPKEASHLSSVDFTKELLIKAKVAFSPGFGFGDKNDNHVRISLIENKERIKQATINIKRYLNGL